MHNRYREEDKEQTAKDEAINEEVKEDLATTEGEVIEDFDEVEKLTAEVKRLTDVYLRSLAETEYFKKRINDERVRERKYGAQRIFERLVEVIDVFDKALGVETDDVKLKNFLIGFEMVNKQLKEIAEEEGVKKIEVKDQKFNPAYHHAMEVGNEKDKEDNIILEIYQNGYLYKDRVLRPALVKVNKKSNKEEKINNE